MVENLEKKLDILYQLYGNTEYFKVLFPKYKPKINSQKPIQKQRKALKLYNSNFNNVGKFTDNVVLEPDYYNQDIDLSRIKFNKSKSKAARGSFATVYLRYLNSHKQIKNNIVFKKINDKYGIEYNGLIFNYLLYFYYQYNQANFPGAIEHLCELKEIGKVIEKNEKPISGLIYGIMDNCGYELFELKKSNLLFNFNRQIRYNFVISIFVKLLNSLQLIHNVGYIHCDIKFGNYLMKIKKIKIIDFGFVRKNPDNQFELIGTSKYTANDFIINYFNQKSTILEYHHDLFSLGCIFIEILYCLLHSFDMKIKILKIACPIIEDTDNKNIEDEKIYELRKAYSEERHVADMKKMLDLLNTNTNLSQFKDKNAKLVEIISKMVHPDPQKRYQTIEPNISPIQTILHEITQTNNNIFSPIKSSIGVITKFLGIATSTVATTAVGALTTFPWNFYSSNKKY